MKNFDKLFESWSSRALLFIGALIVALMVNLFLGMDLVAIPMAPLLLVFFADMWVLVAIPIAWIVYILIILVGVLSTSLRTSQILFLGFVFLLFLSTLVSTLFALGKIFS